MKRIFYCVEIFLLCIILCGCSLEQEKERAVEEKIDFEIEYLNDAIFSIANKHVKGEYIEENEFNWNLVKNDVQKINSSWSTLEFDLTRIKIDNEKIMNCSNSINNILIGVSKKSEQSLLENLYELNKNLLTVKNEYTEDKNLAKKMEVKNDSLKIYYYVFQNDFENAKNEMEKLRVYYKNLMEDESYSEENKYNLNKIYLLIEEYNVSLQIQNFDLIKMKYLNLVERV